ncbi:MAG TPA: diacylglycerol kinase family protein [Chthoniobacterales bacterium]|jgi:diacylglycerol kinase|nr:diacylglycerol kinase family protein [Chthoniobacterales bacterium]
MEPRGNLSETRAAVGSWRDEIQNRYRSFRAALRGLGWLIVSERHFQLHLVAALAAVLLGLVLGLTAMEWAILVLTIGLVLVAEAINTAIEHTIDLTVRQIDPLARTAKDVGAAGVLIAALISVLVGCLLFLPKLLALLHR